MAHHAVHILFALLSLLLMFQSPAITASYFSARNCIIYSCRSASICCVGSSSGSSMCFIAADCILHISTSFLVPRSPHRMAYYRYIACSRWSTSPRELYSAVPSPVSSILYFSFGYRISWQYRVYSHQHSPMMLYRTFVQLDPPCCRVCPRCLHFALFPYP
jgi:hypothetical protein